jgi:hypothetical protein
LSDVDERLKIVGVVSEPKSGSIKVPMMWLYHPRKRESQHMSSLPAHLEILYNLNNKQCMLHTMVYMINCRNTAAHKQQNMGNVHPMFLGILTRSNRHTF